jgi:ATP-binding cassette subfamily B protein/subfamily B ATP-binding cassette protein MsbA
MISPELRFVLKNLFKQKRKLILVALTGITGAACKSYMSIFIQRMIDSSSSYDKLMSIAWIGVALAATVAISRYFHIFTMNVVSENVSQDLREQLQYKFLNLDLKFHNNYITGSGGLLSRTFNDVRIIQDGLRLFADLFSAPLTFVFLIVALFTLDYQLTIYILLVAPLLAFVLGRLSRSIRKYSLMGIEQLEKITSTIKESLDGVRTIQSFSLQNILSTKLKKEGADYIHMRTKTHSRIEFMGPFTEFLATFIVLGIFFYFSTKISLGTATTGSLMGFVTAMLQINEPIKKFQEAYVRLQETKVSAVRIRSMIEEKSVIEENAMAAKFPHAWNEINYKNITFSYSGEHILLKDFNLKITRGQSIAFVGESGSGKSTIANLLARFYDPQSGEISVDGKNINQFSLASLRENISLVSQDIFLFSDTVEKNIQAGQQIYDSSRIVKCAIAASAHQFIQKMPLGYQTNVGERGGLLSGGERQRIAIARAFYKDSPILILDEATSALDSVSEEQVQIGLEHLMKGRTTFVIAHRLSTVRSADMIVVLKKGQVVETGTHDQLIQTGGEYFKLFQTQS